MLKDKDMERIDNLNAKNHYGLSNGMLKTLINKHKAARSNNDEYAMKLVEYRLTDINFHSECGLLMKGNYKEALQMLKSF